MNRLRQILILTFLICISFGLINQNPNEDEILSYSVDLKLLDLQLYWKNDTGEILKNIKNLKTYVENKNLNLIFAMNAGMFNEDFSPKGLFIQQYKTLSPLDTLMVTVISI